jgi:hypothetical protein
MPALDPIYIMVQKNCMKLQPHSKLLMSFDLKGSMFQRQTLASHSFENQKKDPELLVPRKV